MVTAMTASKYRLKRADAKMRNTELQSLGGVERVKVMVMRRRLRRPSQMERMDVSYLPKCLLVSRPVREKRKMLW